MPATSFPRKLLLVLATGILLLQSLATAPLLAASFKGDVDLRPAFDKWGLERRFQGKRGTCSVFAVTGALEYALAHKQGYGTRLSVEYLNWASNQAIGDRHDGSFFSDLWRGFTIYGICPEKDLPYRDTFDPNLVPSEEAKDHARRMHELDLKMHWVKRWNPNTGLTDQQIAEIKRVLRKGWPVCGGFRWPKKPVHWKDDVLPTPPPEGVFDGHSLLLVGYEDNASLPGGGMIAFRNTNTGGRDGYMTYEYAMAYMNDAIWIDDGTKDKKKAFISPLADILGPLGFSPKGRNRRVSSNERPGWHSENLDMDWLMPGDSVNMPILEGPGVITHIWFTSHAGWVGELHALTLRIYYDGSDEPGVEVPLGDFFAVGQGKPATVNSFPVQVSPTGALTCYWRMPFRKQARIVVTNDNPDRSTGLYWQVDWVQLEDLPAETPYFYARYRQEYPAEAGHDYVLADLKGTGYYVGTVMSVTLGQDGWFGEGDDFFYIDGEKIPSLQGTGTEDYFNDAWGFRVRTTPWFGQPRWQGETAGDCGICYRWHLLDPVYFKEALRVEIEHRGNEENSEDGFYFERPDFFSSVAYWYQTGKPRTKFPPLPSWHERRVPWQHHHLVKTYRYAKTSGKAQVSVQTQGFFGARPVLGWPNEEPGAVLTLPFDLSEDGRYAVRLTAARGPGNGTYDIEIDGTKVATNDFASPETAEADVPLGTHELAKGKHTLAFRASDKADEVGPLAVEILRLLKLPPAAKRVVRTHHEAHFIRLGIGRALYAYRLAYDKLPDSLETMVKEGFMPERYLRDENNLPLKAWREGDKMVVQSPGKDHWKHSWMGLDPRR